MLIPPSEHVLLLAERWLQLLPGCLVCVRC